jgi:hypothetical protein
LSFVLGSAEACHSAVSASLTEAANDLLFFAIQSKFMFNPEQRSRLRADLLDLAKLDPRITAAAITGSAAAQREDCWSDIDLAFAVADPALLSGTLADWTTQMISRHSALHHFDVRVGSWIYRVFLLASTLQVDLAFVPACDFRALSPAFQVVFGQANEARPAPNPEPLDLIGMGWLYALHVRSSVARHHLWQAEYMISGLRDTALALACIRHGLPSVHGRGLAKLPREVAAAFEAALVGQLTGPELSRAFFAATQCFLVEIQNVDPQLALRLQEVLSELTQTT